ncbi:MAG: glucosamine-6-phosphate deaminase [Lachnospiraceae bacterium]|nr:glucosamine-6-phosphate deaminase [Lachnospiraceae bacterium]
MKIIAAKDYNDMSRKAANIISAQVILKPDSVLGLATGSTPIGAYKQLIEWYEKGDLDFSQVRTVNPDEYKGLTRDNDQSYYYFMRQNLFNHINIDLANTNIPDGMIEDPQEACKAYDEVIKSLGGIDLQLLGLGNNGHIGFNEPDEIFTQGTNCAVLTESTIQANSRFFATIDEVPKLAYTMGIGQIMSAERVLVVASGRAKAPIIKEIVEGPVTPRVPASILKFHKNAILVADEEALSLL